MYPTDKLAWAERVIFNISITNSYFESIHVCQYTVLTHLFIEKPLFFVMTSSSTSPLYSA